MFENGSLLRRRKRFKLHKPDKELLKSELQAFASSMPPPPHSVEPTGSGCASTESSVTSGLSAANLHRLREDLLRWEMQERRMMVAAASSAGAGFPLDGTSGPETAPGYYLLTAEARQRLAGSIADVNDLTSPYEAAALLQTGNWAFSGFNSSAYMTHLPTYLQTSRQSIHNGEIPDNRHRDRDRDRNTTSRTHVRSTICNDSQDSSYREHNGMYEVGYPERLSGEDESMSGSSSRPEGLYRDSNSPTTSISPTLTKTYRPTDVYRSNTSERLSPNYGDSSECIATEQNMRTPRTSPGIQESHGGTSTTSVMTVTSQVGKKTKKPFTIENIIAPDDEMSALGTVEHCHRATSVGKMSAILQMPRPMYAGYALPITGSAIHRPPYGAAT